jgi:hypothetical protein
MNGKCCYKTNYNIKVRVKASIEVNSTLDPGRCGNEANFKLTFSNITRGLHVVTCIVYVTYVK